MSAGWEYPVRITGEHGRVAVSRDKENVRQSVIIILTTEPGERLMHPKFGTRLHQFLFENMDSQIKEMIRREICHSLYLWEKRITDITVDIKDRAKDQGELWITVDYRLTGMEEKDHVEILLKVA